MMRLTPALALAVGLGCTPSGGAAPANRAGAASSSPPVEEYAPSGFSLREVSWPAGVVSELVQEVPKEWQREAVPTFEVESPIAEEGHLLVRGWLVNDTEQPVVTYLSSAPHTLTPLAVTMVGRDVQLRPYTGAKMPEIYPAPERLTLPPNTRVAYERAVVLARYRYEPGAKATLTWVFSFWRKPASGTFEVALP